MDEITSGLDPDDLMDLDEGEGSDLDDDDEEIIDEPGQSPFQLLSSGAGSTTTSATSSPPNNDDIPPPFSFTGKPLSIRRGRGRPPRREGDRGGKPFQRSPRVNLGSSNGGNRMRRVRPPGVSRGGGQRQRFKQFMDSTGFDFSCLTSSPDDIPMLDPETGALIFAAEKEKPTPPTPEELPYAPEQWPGKVCALCNLGERSQLGQGEMLRLNCPEGFIPQRVTSEHNSIVHMPERDSGERSPRGPVTCRRQKSFNKCRHPSMTSEYIDEFTLIGYSEQPGVGALFESVGHFYVHRSCTLWSYGVVRNENSTLGNVGPVVLQSSSRKCSFCNHYGASLVCKVDGCPKIYHYPCATASGAFQELSSLTLFCSSHLNQVSLVCESSVCYTCKTLGDIANLMYCSSCGQHYHGICVGLAQLPGVRAGWQCRRCRICQVCRTTGDETKLMGCEQCDKVYHSTCQRPIVTTIPKYGWKCRCCRICGDCGSRTPGAGLSSRWHAHYTVCDSCYQQRNKGFSCPLCHRAYRAHAHREMVQCTGCRRFVHGTCDPEADVITYHQKKETNPDYEYVCLICKNNQQNHARNQIVTKRNSIDDLNELSASQESLYDDISEYDFPFAEESTRIVGLGKGKPYTASKIAKKRLGFAPGKPGRPKGLGKGLPGKTGFMKRNRLTEFGRKRGQKAKMRGIFGVPGVGLQRPVSDGKNDEEPGVENRLVLCSAKDKFVLTQDICVMCGALGTDQEGCLIGCVQCGQCYHPYCLNVKVTKVILQKGWRCLDCTVCEGCGQRNDEGRLILCDDCDISFHIYCMDPPLEYVPHGNWKCKWCAVCQNCGATDPGFNCNWMNGWTECGPCASHVNCPSCTEPYSEGDLIIQCVQCERWLHGACDLIKTEDDAERCAEEGYCCILCRPRDVPPPHLVPSAAAPKPPTPTKSPEMKAHTNYFIDGVYLSESGHSLIKSLSMEHHGTRKKRKKLPTVQDKEAGIMATIESVVAGGCVDNSLEESAKLELVDVKEEPQEIFKEGMIWTKEDGPPPEGFTIFTMENGVSVLRRKRQRNLQKLGIGGFLVRVRGIRGGQENDDIDVLPGQTTPTGSEFPPPLSAEGEKPRRKPVRRKPKSKLAETFPAYLQEAFFGKDLMDVMECKKEVDTSGSDEEMDKTKTIQLSQDELKAVAAVTAKQEFSGDTKDALRKCDIKRGLLVAKEEEDDNAEDLKDVLALPGELLDPELVDTIMNEDDDELTKNTESLEVLANSNLTDDADLADTLGSSSNSKDTKDELSDILGPHFSLSDINSKDVEDIFKGVLTDESQESQESNVFPMQNSNMFGVGASQNTIPQHPIPTPPVRPTTLPTVNQNNLNSPISIPPQSPYHSEYSNSPQFSPAFPEANSQWMAVNEPPEVDTSTVGVPSTYNQRSSEKMKADEGLGNGATISAVLYANMNHPEWKTEFPNWSDRYKQIIKKWRTLSTEQKAPYLQHARDNRSQLRMKKAQQDQEKIALQQKSAREAEQERQWKQLQAMRQQQAQQQQNVIHEQRAQAIARVHKQISDPGPQFLQEQPSPLQPSTPQELSPAPSPSPVTRQFLGMKSPPFPHPSPLSQSAIRTPTPTPPPHDFSNQPTTPTTETNDPYTQPPATPKTGGFQPRLPGSDSFTLQPPTPRPLQFSTPRPTLQGFPSRPDQPEINRQLRDLLQRQQFKKLDEQLLAGKGQQRLWPPANENQESESPTPTSAVTTTDTTFRQPLPPSMARPRLPVSVTSIARPGGQVIGMRMPQIDARMQGLDPRMRLILQQQQQRLAQAGVQNLQPGQQFLPGAVRFASGSPVRPASVEQYEQLLQRQAQLQSRAADQQAQPRLPLLQQAAAIQRQTAQVPVTTSSGSGSDVAGNDQEIPDNVTAELEKLEQETGNMVELHGVSDILGGLGDDDDELLAEMGADFNILEYADPELEALSGEKTNILDLELEEETINKNLKKAKENLHKAAAAKPAPAAAIQTLRKEAVAPPLTEVRSTPTPTATSNLQPPPLAVTQPQPQVQPPQPTSVAPQSQPPPPIPHLTPQQIHQQMVHQVQQAAAQGRPMPPGSKLQTPDGIIGVVMPNNNVQLQIPQNYHQRLLVQQLQNQKLQMRVGQPVPRMMSVAVKPNVVQPAVVGPRMVGVPPPPPPPYPGPPPPYPGNSAPPQQQQEQPLLLEELLEQEKREQEKQQHQAQPANHEVSSTTAGAESESSGLLSDHDFERLKADIFSGGTMGIAPPANQSNTGAITHQPWQQTTSRPAPTPTPQPPPEVPPRVQTFNANLLPAPPLPPENIVTDQDKQTQLVYEQWLNHQNNVLTQQLRYYDTEVQKLRKIRKSLNSKQRQLRKSGNQLAEADAAELQRISSEQSILQKHLESSRKQSRQHGMLIQEYRNKQQAKQQRPTPGQSPLQQQMQSPLGPPASSPIHHPSTSQSPMMSPSASPLTQHSSPMHSPGPLVSHSPGPGSIGNILQSPSSSLTGGSNMSPMQPSPRIGTPHSQGDGSPGPVQSPSQICLPPPAPRMTSPQHRRVVTSPVGYTGDLRPGTPQMRFIRTPIDHAALQQRVRLASPLQNFQQKPGTVSPLSSPPSSQQITQQLLQKQLQQQLLMQQQQGLEGAQQESTNLLHSQRAAQLLQHRNLIRQQPQQSIGQPQPLTPQQHQMMIQQQQQLAKQQQQQIAQLQAQGRLSQQANPPHSPMPPKSPMLAQQIMSPHSMPASPMPPKSPMLTSFNAGQTPNSPISRSPAFPQSLNQQQPPNSPMNHSQYQPPNSPMPRSPMLVQTQSPMTHRRTPSANSSPAMPDRPMSVENPTTPRTPYSIESQIQENMHTGGGNPHNPNNPIPLPPGFGRFGYFKLGLRGGAPMWGFGRGAKRVPTPPIINKIELDKSNSNDVPLSLVKPRKESHLSKVSILKRKSPVKTNLQSMAVSKVGSLVSTDYNEFEDSSSPPPGTPPPMASSSRINVQRTIPRKHPETIHGLEEKPAIRNCEDIIDFDDNTVLSNEVSLSSAAQQNDGDDIEMESLSQNDLGEDLSSPLESDQIPDEYVLFPGNIGVGEDEVEEYGGGNMHIVIRSPTTSDDEFIMQDKTKKFNLVQSQDHRMSMSGTPESTEHDEINMDPSPEATEDEMLNNYDDDILVIDHSVKSPDEQISTKEDFEELIDEGSRKEKILKHEVVTTKHVNEVHKYATNTFVPQKAVANHNRIANLMNQKNMQKISLEPPKISPDVILAQSPKPASKLTSIILAHNTAAVRTNVLSVTKIVSSVSPAITFVSAATSQIASILPSKFTVPVISASAVRQLPNVKVIDKPSSSLSLTTHDSVLPKKIFEDDSVSPDSSNCEDDKSKDSSDEKSKSPCADEIKHPLFSKVPTDNVRIIKSFKHETNVLNYSKPVIKVETSKPSEPIEKECEGAKDLTTRKVENLQIQNLMVKDQAQRIPSPIISKTSPPVIIHNTPELTMTAQVIQETQPRMQSETSDVYDVSSLDDTKSVVISIPSPTPSQEQMLDNIALQALEHRRKDGKGIPGGFESFEDVLDMIENITGEPPTVLEDNIKEKLKHEEEQLTVPPPKIPEAPKEKVTNVKMDKQSMVPQLSPLSQPTDLTTNITNASQQLRTLLSLHTTTTSAATSVETVVKSMHKIVNSTSPVVTTSTVSSRVIQQTERQSPIVTNVSTVIVPNVKPKPAVPSAIHPPKGSPVRPQPISIQNHLTSIQNHLTNAPIHNHLTSSPIQNHLSSASFQSHLTSSPIMSFSQTTPALNLLPNRTIHLMADQTKISSAVTTVISTNQSSVIAEQKKPSVITPTTTSETTRKPSLTLTAMLQSHPAATPSSKPSAESITAASLLASPINISRGLSTALIQAQPNAVVSPATPKSPLPFNLSTTTVATVISSPTFRQVPTSTNLLHTQLTKVIRRKSLEEPKDINIGDIKQEVIEPTEEKCIIVTTSSIKQEFAGCKFSTIPTPLLSRTEDSQNVLLKKLLQNTACASTQTPPPNSGSTIITTAPITTTSEAHITKATPTLTSLLPPVVKTEAQTTVHPQITKPTPQRVPIMTRETSFVSSPVIQQPQTTNAAPVATQQLHIDIKKCLPPSRTPSRDDLLSPPTPRSSCSQDSTSLQTPPLVIKKEIPSLPPHQSPVSMPQEIKKEFMDESSQHSEVSDHSRSDLPMMKEEMDTLENSNEKTLLDKEELKKQKRRMYQQKRRQNILNKETVGQPKKRPRKSSKVEEDYDTYIDGVLNQMRNLPAMTVSEPVLNRNFGVVPVFGSGDMSKLGTKGYDSRFGELTGKYGDASIPGYSDFYSTKPYGDLEPLPEKPPISTQRGFYDQEFPLIKFDTEEDKKLDLFCREDTPDSIVSSSSPECGITEENDKFLGLRLISDNEDEDDDINDEEEEVDEEKKKLMGRLSPVVPLIKPIPIRLKPAGLYLKEHSEQEKEKDPSENKENINQELVQTKMKPDSNPATPLKDNGNVTVTLTLTSSAAEDIMGVLRDLANILHIPAPTSYQIVERTNTPPSQKLGLYRTKGKDGKEGAPIDIQSILNGAAKFCKHCDVVILNNMIRRKVSDLPFLSKDSELLSDGEELHFCSTTCYTQFALMHRSPSISEDKAAAIIDHLSQKDRHETKQKRSLVEAFEQRRSIFRMDVDFKREDHHLGDPSRSLFTRPFDFGKYKKEEVHAAPKMYRNVRYKVWVPGCLQPSTKHKKPTDKEIMELLYRLGITVAPPKMPEDTRRCMFCQGIGDSVADGPARLLNFDVDKWVHLNCALWSDGVYETVNGALMNLENAIQHSFVSYCIHCSRSGATIRCFKTRCSGVYHLSCAVKDGCVFFKNKTVYCTVHVPKGEKDNELTTLSVSRRVYVNRDENRQVAAVMHHSDTSNLLRVGSLIFLNVGQLLPHQLQNFHTPNFIYPIGYKIIRFYWSMRRLNKRCRYICSIHDVCGRPEFRVLIQEQSEEDRELKDPTPKGVWHRILEEVSALRKANQCLQMFPKFVSGEDLFGLTEPAVVRVLESLPGIETLTDYKFKYGRNPLLELPLAINPSGAARCEPKLKNQQHWKRHHTQRTAGPTTRPLFGPSPVGPMPPTLGEITCPYSKQFVHSKSSQYKKMKQEWRNNVYLARSKIQGLGLYAARDLEKHTMVIEYIGEIIRTELAECREKQYEAKNRGIYMFRLDEERVVDATLSGGLARYINHSCNPNCVAETVEVDRDLRIIIFAKRRIQRGEELAYDYKFDIEDDQHKISCMCGAPNCRKWMN